MAVAVCSPTNSVISHMWNLKKWLQMSLPIKQIVTGVENKPVEGEGRDKLED